MPHSRRKPNGHAGKLRPVPQIGRNCRLFAAGYQTTSLIGENLRMSSISSGNVEQYGDSRKLAARGRLNSEYTVDETGWFAWVNADVPSPKPMGILSSFANLSATDS